MQAMMRINNLTVLLSLPFLFLIWQGNSCGHSTMEKSANKTQRVAVGTWGGMHIIVTVTDEGASLVMDCARGTINEPLEIDANGRFDVGGLFMAETPGPAVQGEESRRKVRYQGVVKSDSMELTIAATGRDEKLGSFNLTHGKLGKIRRCL